MIHGEVAGTARPDDADVSFESFVDGTSARLFAMALLLTGRNRAEAEDLLQGVLERAYRQWRRICNNGDPEPYVRKMLVNASLDLRRRLRRRAEQPWPSDSLQPAVREASTAVDDRDLLIRALAMLSAGQRAVLVLRYFCDLTEAQTAAALGCSVGSVKSQAARGLARLRTIADPASDPDTPATRGTVRP